MILSVLKVIGIILLIILLLVIFILGLLLFVPIRYRFAGAYDRELTGEAKVRWIPVLLRIDASVHNNQTSYVIKLFGGVVMTNTDCKISWIGRKFFSFEEEVEEAVESVGENLTGGEANNTDEAFEKNEKAFTDSQKIQKTQKIERTQKTEGTKKNSFSLFHKIQSKLKQLKKRWQTFINRLKGINKKKEELLKVYHSKRFDKAKQDTKSYMIELFRIIRPDKAEGKVHFGMEDPAVTGEILGGLACILPLYQDFLTIIPDFQEKCLEGNLKGKGKIFLFQIVKLAIKVMCNKNLIKVTKKVQTIIEA